MINLIVLQKLVMLDLQLEVFKLRIRINTFEHCNNEGGPKEPTNQAKGFKEDFLPYRTFCPPNRNRSNYAEYGEN